MDTIYSKKWEQDPLSEERKKGIILLAKAILSNKILSDKKIHSKYIKELLSILIWKITEIHGKHNTRYISFGVKNNKGKPIHEHVIPRKILIEQILKSPKQTEEILNSTIGCLVTKEEHALLDNNGNGWERYKIAKIKVYDRLNGNYLKFSK